MFPKANLGKVFTGHTIPLTVAKHLLAKQVRKVLWSRKVPACLLTLLCAYCKLCLCGALENLLC